MITQHVCPWCGEVVAEIDGEAELLAFIALYAATAKLPAAGDYYRFRSDQSRALEETIAAHLVSRHPVRRRLSRRTRIALRASRVEA